MEASTSFAPITVAAARDDVDRATIIGVADVLRRLPLTSVALFRWLRGGCEGPDVGGVAAGDHP